MTRKPDVMVLTVILFVAATLLTATVQALI